MISDSPKPIMVPAPTPWPFAVALAITLIFAGVVTHIVVSITGVIVLLRSGIGWWFDVLPAQREEPVTTVPADEITASPRAVDRLAPSHRKQIPVEVHPYSTGFTGGLVGGAAMAIVAVIFGLISEHSIWYPVNLLAAGVVPSLASVSVEQLRHFSQPGLIAGILAHGTISILVGLLYAVSLPMFPRGATWRSGLLTPVLWSGLVAATLWTINPTLNARIDWGWFVASQIAYGLAASHVIARTAKIATMQNLPLLERAGIEGQREPNENVDL